MRAFFLFLFGLLQFTTLHAQYGDRQVVFNRSPHYSVGIAPPIGNNEGFIYSAGGEAGIDIYRIEGEHFSSGEAIFGPGLYFFREVRHIDIDQDQDWDLIALGQDDKIMLIPNQGGNRFGAAQVLNDFDPRDPARLYTLDLEGDGDMDFLFSVNINSLGDTQLRTFVNQGQGQLEEGGFPLKRSPSCLVIGDFDNKAGDDIIYVNSDDEAYLLIDTGAARFLSFPLDTFSQRIVYGIATDLGDDGDQDVLLAGGDGIYFLENNGDATFQPAQKIISGNYSPEQLVMIDEDGDGDQDLIVSHDGELLLFKRAAGELDPNPIVLSTKVRYPEALEVGDIDGDQDPDLLFGTSYHDLLMLYRNSGTDLKAEMLDAESWVRFHLDFADVDQDGLLDILPSHTLMAKTNGNDQFIIQSPLKDSILNGVDQSSCCPQTGNLNGDDAPDMAVFKFDRSIGGNRCIHLFHNVGGEFVFSEAICPDGRQVQIMRLLDINQDGLDDLIYYADKVTTIGKQWYVHFNDGNGRFMDREILDLCCLTPQNFYQGEDIVLQDLTQDGIPELVVLQGRGVYYHRGLGNGQYEDYTTVAGQNDFDRLFYQQQIIDWNGDGLLDFVGTYDGNPVFIPNLGNGQFGDRTIISTLFIPSFFLVGDGNGDGHLDFFYTLSDEHTYFHPHKDGAPLGNPTIVFQKFFLPGYVLENIYLRDLHADGDLDLIGWAGGRVFVATNYSEAATISGKVFWDLNQDSLFDIGEPSIPNAKINIQPNSLSTYTTNDGSYIFYTGAGTYDLSATTSECWIPIDTAAVTLVVGAQSINHDFSFIPSPEDTTIITTHVQYGFTRCNRTVPAWISITNEGCTQENIRLEIRKDTVIGFNAFDLQPSGETDSLYYWIFDELLPGDERKFKILLDLPGADWLNNQLGLQSKTFLAPNNGPLELVGTADHSFTLFCSYDPNDKQVQPFSPEVGNPTYFEEDQLTYTVRFQNNGNDTAFRVVIVDTLDAALDINTFQPLTASHAYRSELDEKARIARFIFDPIALPDSTTNEPESMGFVSFRISFDSTLPIGTSITNRAGIYFDQNPVILTNTVVNTLSDIPTHVKTPGLSATAITVIPNPNRGQFSLQFEGEQPLPLRISILDILGRPVYSTQLRDPDGARIALPDPKPGIYLILLEDQHGVRFLSSKKIIIH